MSLPDPTNIKEGWYQFFEDNWDLLLAINDKIPENYIPANPFYLFELLNPNEVKVVILGQDPYPNPEDAHGIAFSSLSKTRPASLRNIFIEAKIKSRPDNDLTSWVKQGVFLLNTILTFSDKNSKHTFWYPFTTKVIDELQKYDNIVYMLWGKDAKSYCSRVKNKTALILESVHPSPLSASKGFFGCDHFNLCNKYLESKNIGIIDWS